LLYYCIGLHRFSRKRASFLHNSTKHWPIQLIYGTQQQGKNLT